MVWTTFNYDSIDPLILSVGEEDEVSIRDVALLIAEAMEFEGEVVFDTSKADGQFKKTANNGKLKSLLPDVAFTPIQEGLRASVQWFIDHYESCRK